MGFQARKQTDSIALALLLAHNDTRKGSQVATAVAFGTFTLSGAGAATVSNAKFNAGTIFITAMQTVSATSLSVDIKQTPSAGSMALQGLVSAGTNNSNDQSTYAYMAITPLFHADQTCQVMTGDFTNPTSTNLTVTAAAAADLPTSITIANQMRQVANQMMADATSHLAADTTNPIATALAVDLPSTITLLNQIKTSFNAHLTQSGVHVNNDTTNNVATSNASDLPSSITLANALKSAMNAHLGSAPTGESVALINA